MSNFNYCQLVWHYCGKGNDNTLLRGLRMVLRALWRSDACRVVPWSETRSNRKRVHWHSQGTTLSGSDLRNAQANFLNPFYNMYQKINKKIWHNKTLIEEDIPCINATPNRYTALAPAIVFVGNDVTIPFNSMTSQSQHKEPYCALTWMGPTSFWILRIGS